ncbi:MAG: hypothetical protein F2951_02155 [Actinobacteria bacterium]|uniref:Unannotated protein n=1 Tax=freshwater metagenome TaxID=449393 RepID=A0A6J7V8Q9_9ZZZZ|nr:hypothetical protein [Actinomycetota bacterium]
MVEIESWIVEYYEGRDTFSSFESWMDSLSDVKFAALSAAIELVLVPNGLKLIGTHWLKHVEKGIFEFRIKYSAADIKAMYANLEINSPMPPAKILIRLFIHFHGSKIILLLNGYDKARNDKPKRQQMEIKLARLRLQRWRAGKKY